MARLGKINEHKEAKKQRNADVQPVEPRILNEKPAGMEAQMQPSAPPEMQPVTGTHPVTVGMQHAMQPSAPDEPIPFKNAQEMHDVIAPRVRSNIIQGMTEDEAMKQGNISPAEYWQEYLEKAKANGRELTGYEMTSALLNKDNWKTPDELKRDERREQLGEIFNNLGNVIGNAANLYYTAKGTPYIDLNTSMGKQNERMQQIRERRRALKDKTDMLLLNAKIGDAEAARQERLLAKKQAAKDAADAADKAWDAYKFNINAGLQRDRNKNYEQRNKEQARHNKQMEAKYGNGGSDTSRVSESVTGNDDAIYTRKTRLSDTEKAQLVNFANYTPEELQEFSKLVPVLDGNGIPMYDGDEPVTKYEVDWDEALNAAIRERRIPTDELVSRGFKLGGKKSKKSKEGWSLSASAKQDGVDSWSLK